MNRSEVINLLTMCAAFDQRTVGDADVDAWLLAIGDLDARLAAEAVVVHHRTNTDRIKPAHVRNLSIAIRKDRAEREDADQRRLREDLRDQKLGLAPPNAAFGGLPIASTDGKPIDLAYTIGGALEKKCPRCKADPGEVCWNVATSNTTKIPCLERMKNQED